MVARSNSAPAHTRNRNLLYSPPIYNEVNNESSFRKIDTYKKQNLPRITRYHNVHASPPPAPPFPSPPDTTITSSNARMRTEQARAMYEKQHEQRATTSKHMRRRTKPRMQSGEAVQHIQRMEQFLRHARTHGDCFPALIRDPDDMIIYQQSARSGTTNAPHSLLWLRYARTWTLICSVIKICNSSISTAR